MVAAWRLACCCEAIKSSTDSATECVTECFSSGAEHLYKLVILAAASMVVVGALVGSAGARLGGVI